MRMVVGRRSVLVWLWLVGAALLVPWPGMRAEAQAPAPGRSGEQLYRAACAACHGADGTGAPASTVGFEDPLPDFTSCTFATREPDADWVAVAHEGGPVRAFASTMPAFGGALTMDELQRVMDHVRTFCNDPAWPRGDLNLPRPLVTEKAYPEDEAVFASAAAGGTPGAVENELIFEKRFGARTQLEVKLPFGWRERAAPGAAGWIGGVGDVALGLKRVLFHGLGSGTILSGTAEVILPSGDRDDGFGAGTTVFEPFLSLGQFLPLELFLHAQAGLALPAHEERAAREGFWRGVLGRTFTEGPFGRAWSPMVEVLGARELSSGAPIHWDVVPQLQLSLNTRQHILANLGVRVPLDDDARDPQVLFYLLWDWFDGGLLEGW